MQSNNQELSTVFLIGAGPGDPELMTRKAIRLLEEANIVLYDSLIGQEILDFASKKAELIFVGKRCGKHSMSQNEINSLLIEKSKIHKNIVRLKGGDPFLFGRGGEELAELRQSGIQIEIVPGVTTASAVAASLQIPLTHRISGQSVIFLSGHTSDPTTGHTGVPKFDWNFLAQNNLTLVIYMGVRNRSRIAKHLLDAGKAGNTPVALVSHVSRVEESEIITDLISLASDQSDIPTPALLVIGDVINYSWLVNHKDTKKV